MSKNYNFRRKSLMQSKLLESDACISFASKKLILLSRLFLGSITMEIHLHSNIHCSIKGITCKPKLYTESYEEYELQEFPGLRVLVPTWITYIIPCFNCSNFDFLSSCFGLWEQKPTRLTNFNSASVAAVSSCICSQKLILC